MQQWIMSFFDSRSFRTQMCTYTSSIYYVGIYTHNRLCTSKPTRVLPSARLSASVRSALRRTADSGDVCGVNYVHSGISHSPPRKSWPTLEWNVNLLEEIEYGEPRTQDCKAVRLSTIRGAHQTFTKIIVVILAGSHHFKGNGHGKMQKGSHCGKSRHEFLHVYVESQP